MDTRIFADGLMGLKDDLLTVPLEARFAYDTGRNMFFLNMEGMSLATLDEVESIGTEIEKRLAAIGKKVQMVVNYDNFYLAPDLTDAYVTLVRRLAEQYYVAVTRYTTSSFMRLKLSEQLSNRVWPAHLRKPSGGDALAREIATGQCSRAFPSAPAPVSDRTSISAALYSRCSLLVIVPRYPSRNDAGIETRPGLASGNKDQSEFGNMAVALPDTAGENAISTTVRLRPP